MLVIEVTILIWIYLIINFLVDLMHKFLKSINQNWSNSPSSYTSVLLSSYLSNLLCVHPIWVHFPSLELRLDSVSCCPLRLVSLPSMQTSVRLSMCCIFWPAFSCCTIQGLVKIYFFLVFHSFLQDYDAKILKVSIFWAYLH